MSVDLEQRSKANLTPYRLTPYRVRNKIFAVFGETEDDPRRKVVTMKAAPGEQASLFAEGGQFFYPKYVGAKGWIGVYLDSATDWDEVAELIEESYRVIAPKRLASRLDLD